jgi:serine/threonine-protein kinase
MPPLGTTVGGFVLEALLGQGGYGTVYLARRGGCLFAVKLISLPQAGEWARRELDVMLRLEGVGGVGLKGHGFWPDEAPLFLFIAMEYVPGEELYEWARHHNPHALGVVDVLLELGRELAVVHSAGVVHRDIKGDNVLVRHADGLPVLLDFSVATYQGAPRVTGQEVPGCREYLSPQAVRFNHEHASEARYPASAADDLWALGVLACKLLTATYPFQGHNAVETERRILHAQPEPPHVRNPRVPRAVGEVCLRLLEKEPAARYPDADAVVAALEEVRRGADETWRVPLCEAWGPDAATTQRQGPLSMEQLGARWKRLVDYERRHPRRGMPRLAPPSEGARPVPGWTVGQGVRVLVLAGMGLLCAGHARPVSLSARPSLLVASRVTSQVSSWGLTPEVVFRGQEVALWGKPPEGAGSAAPGWAATPAPVASATPPKDTRVKISRKDSAPLENNPRPRSPGPQAKETGPLARRAGTALLTCALATGCSGPATQVRPQPPGPAECPAGSAEAMSKLRAWTRLMVTFHTSGGGRVITVSGGEATVMLRQTSGTLVAGSTLTGQLIVTDKRVYGRFTRARLPNGETFPVCFEISEFKAGEEVAGISVEEPAPEPGLARIFSTQGVEAVTRFGLLPEE